MLGLQNGPLSKGKRLSSLRKVNLIVIMQTFTSLFYMRKESENQKISFVVKSRSVMKESENYKCSFLVKSHGIALFSDVDLNFQLSQNTSLYYIWEEWPIPLNVSCDQGPNTDNGIMLMLIIMRIVGVTQQALFVAYIGF